MKNKKNLNDIIVTLTDFIIKEIEDISIIKDDNEVGLILHMHDYWNYPHIKESVKRVRLFLLEQILEFSPEKESIEYEKLSELIVNIDDIYDEYFKKFKGKISNNILDNSSLQIIDRIKNQNSYKAKGIVDATNQILDFNKNRLFTLNVHATSNTKTQTGQGMLFFNAENSAITHIKNIYIIKKLIVENNQGKLFKEGENINILNILPFLSMLQKICYSSSSINNNYNLVYFMKTPLIIIGDDYWKEYNQNIASVYIQNSDLNNWFYNYYYDENYSNNLERKVLTLLYLLAIQMVNLIQLNHINDALTSKEKECLSHLYNFIKAIEYFTAQQNIDIRLPETLFGDLKEQIENLNKKIGFLGLVQLEHKEIFDDNTFNDILLDLQDLKITSYFTNNNVIINSPDSNYIQFITDLKKYFNIKETKNDLIQCIKTHYPNATDIFLNFFISHSTYPNFKHIESSYVNPKNILLFKKFFILFMTETNIQEWFAERDIINQAHGGYYSGSLNFYRNRLSEQNLKMLLISEVLYGDKKLNKILYKYIENIILTEKINRTNLTFKTLRNTNKEIVMNKIKNFINNNEVHTYKMVEPLIMFAGGGVSLEILDLFDKNSNFYKSLQWYLRNPYFGPVGKD